MAVLITIISFTSCGMGKRAQVPERKETRKLWYLCTEKQVKNPEGKVCSSECKKRDRNGDCKYFPKVIIRDLGIPEVHKTFRDATMIMINENDL